MQQADFDHTHFQQDNEAGDAALLVKFFDKSVQDKAKTEAEGRPVFKDVCYVDIRTVGSKNGFVCRPARQQDKTRFPKHYEAYKQRAEVPTEGTPLVEWTLISRSQAEELAYLNVKTVEQLASVSDGNISVIMGGYDLKSRAKKWLEQAKNVAQENVAEAVKSAKEEAAEQRARADMLEERLAKLEASMMNAEPEAEAEAEPTPKRASRRNRK